MKKLLPLLALSLCLLPFCAEAQNDKNFEISKNLEVFANVYKTLNNNYVDDVDPGKAIKTAIDAMLASMDPYTNYYPESDMEDVKMQMLGQYGGVGSLIHMELDSTGKTGKHFIAEPFEGMPADLAGARAGDQILAVNGESTEGKTTSEVSNAMRGQAGTTVTLTLMRDGKTFDLPITRKEIHMPNVPYSGMVKNPATGEKNIGYIYLNEFTQDAAKNVREAFLQLKRSHPDMKGVILDLRGNGGGLMNEAIDIVNIWVKSGELVVEQKGKLADRNQKHRTSHAPDDTKMPVAVLINEHSASASEIVSGSLQDLDRAVIIGSRSFGKGLVQNILPMPYNNQMKVTVSKYFIPSGRCIQAIDYSRRDANGRAVKVPDSLKTAYKTRNGRIVYDGFGIEPDIEVEGNTSSLLTVALYNKFLFFQYATKFRREHESIAPASEFVVTDEIYNDFINFLADKTYEYTTYTERLLKEMHRVAKEENYIDEINNQLEQLEETFKNAKKDDLMRNREDISRYLRDEILVRYYYNRGRLEGSLADDPDVLKAAEVLSNPEEYNKILNP